MLILLYLSWITSLDKSGGHGIAEKLEQVTTNTTNSIKSKHLNINFISPEGPDGSMS
jgi:hypothetical protein